MCGIAGIINFDGQPVDPAVLESLGSAMRHRGPDGAGYLTQRHFGLVHRRLSIIDLAGGTQPIYNEDRSVAVILNGEIYNYQELTSRLVARGHTFATRSDTEVLVHLYEDQPDFRFLSDVNGMFAFALLDLRRHALFLVRDRLGKKPLYYYSDDDRFAFASELNALRQVPGIELSINPDAVDCYFRYQYVPAPMSIYNNVAKLEPATVLKIHARGMEKTSYWEPPLPDPDYSKSADEFGAEYEEVLSDAIRIRMISDVPLGAFLSGGMDSSAIVQLMSRISTSPIRTFNIGFAEASFDESAFARQVAERIGSQHCHYQLDPLEPPDIDEAIKYFGEPFADMSALPTYQVCRIARENVTVALSGDGADETLAGYNRYVASEWAAAYLNLPPQLRPTWALRAVAKLPEGTGYYGKSWLKKAKLFARFLHGVAKGDPSNLAPLLFSTAERQRLFTDDVRDSLGQSADPVELCSQRFADLGRTNRMLWLDLKTYLADNIHVKVDRMSMAHSLEVRAPFMDFRLIELLARMPLEYKIRRSRTKILLKKILSEQLPEIARRKKQGFELPIGTWFKQQLREPVRDLLSSSLARDYFQTDYLEQLLSRHQGGFEDNTKKIWSIFVFLNWAERHADAVDRPTSERASPLPLAADSGIPGGGALNVWSTQ